ELDTVTDFILYLRGKEEAIRNGFRPMIVGGEEDLLAVYLQHGRSFPKEMVTADAVMLDGPLWGPFVAGAQYQSKKEADRISYTWDGIMDYVGSHALGGTLEPGSTLSDAERVIRVLARESRLNRRILSEAFVGFHQRSDIRSRMLVSPSGVCYVFLTCPPDFPREDRKVELANRCFVARGRNPERSTVVAGIATEDYSESGGYSFDLTLIDMPEWTEADEAAAGQMQQEHGYLTDPTLKRFTGDEYPVDGGSASVERDSADGGPCIEPDKDP
ncbi:MAG: hypothetical protein ACYS9X_25095, partial [Planctomycetota bacterium]